MGKINVAITVSFRQTKQTHQVNVHTWNYVNALIRDRNFRHEEQTIASRVYALKMRCQCASVLR